MLPGGGFVVGDRGCFGVLLSAVCVVRIDWLFPAVTRVGVAQVVLPIALEPFSSSSFSPAFGRRELHGVPTRKTQSDSLYRAATPHLRR